MKKWAKKTCKKHNEGRVISSWLTMQRQHYSVTECHKCDGGCVTPGGAWRRQQWQLWHRRSRSQRPSVTPGHQWGACDEALMWLVHVRRGECWLAVLTLGRHHLLFWCLTQHFSARTEESTEFSRFLLRKTFFQNIDMDNSLLPYICLRKQSWKKIASHFVVRVERLHEKEHLWLFSWLFNLFPFSIFS